MIATDLRFWWQIMLAFFIILMFFNLWFPTFITNIGVSENLVSRTKHIFRLQVDSRNCEICKCQKMQECPSLDYCSEKKSEFTPNVLTPNDLVFLVCPYGYRQDRNGCDLCQCRRCSSSDCFIKKQNGNSVLMKCPFGFQGKMSIFRWIGWYFLSF